MSLFDIIGAIVTALILYAIFFGKDREVPPGSGMGE